MVKILDQKAFYSQAVSFLEALFQKINETSLDISSYELDHLCFRVGTAEEYREYSAFLLSIGTALIESEIGGRKIITFKLSAPIIFKDREVDVLELPAPKAHHGYVSGFEHAEFVITESFCEFQKQYSEIEFDLSGSKKGLNPDIRLKFSPNMSIKFHHNSLEDVIELEKHLDNLG